MLKSGTQLDISHLNISEDFINSAKPDRELQFTAHYTRPLHAIVLENYNLYDMIPADDFKLAQ